MNKKKKCSIWLQVDGGSAAGLFVVQECTSYCQFYCASLHTGHSSNNYTIFFSNYYHLLNSHGSYSLTCINCKQCLKARTSYLDSQFVGRDMNYFVSVG